MQLISDISKTKQKNTWKRCGIHKFLLKNYSLEQFDQLLKYLIICILYKLLINIIICTVYIDVGITKYNNNECNKHNLVQNTNSNQEYILPN